MDRNMKSNNKQEQLKELQSKIGYNFKSPKILETALTHSSYANESKRKISYNERLEFLGDSVLSVAISEYLYSNCPDLPEGELTKIRACIVSEPSLSQAAKSIQLGGYLRLGKGEKATGGQERSSILADALESIIGAVYLDGGLNSAKEFILRILKNCICNALCGEGIKDYKTDLQELLQKHSLEPITYQIVNEYGPDHNKCFVAKVFHGKNEIGSGMGKSKKEAEQQAACKALEDMYE